MRKDERERRMNEWKKMNKEDRIKKNKLERKIYNSDRTNKKERAGKNERTRNKYWEWTNETEQMSRNERE